MESSELEWDVLEDLDEKAPEKEPNKDRVDDSVSDQSDRNDRDKEPQTTDSNKTQEEEVLFDISKIDSEISTVIKDEVYRKSIVTLTYPEIPGLYYTKNIITEDQEAELISFAESGNWIRAPGGRLVQQFTLFPPILRALAKHVGMPKSNNVLISKYLPGSGMQPKISNLCFDEAVVSISLAASIGIVFKRGSDRHSIYAEPRSAIVLQGEARYNWSHEIEPKIVDIVDMKEVPRAVRYGVTFKTLI